MTKNWKFLTKSEVSKVMGSSIEVYDSHFDNVFNYDAVVCEVNGHMYLAACDFHCNKIFPLMEKNGRLEVINTLTLGYLDGSNLNICKVFSESDNAKLYWRNQVTLANSEIDGIEKGIAEKLNNGDYETVKVLNL